MKSKSQENSADFVSRHCYENPDDAWMLEELIEQGWIKRLHGLKDEQAPEKAFSPSQNSVQNLPLWWVKQFVADHPELFSLACMQRKTEARLIAKNNTEYHRRLFMLASCYPPGHPIQRDTLPSVFASDAQARITFIQQKWGSRLAWLVVSASMEINWAAACAFAQIPRDPANVKKGIVCKVVIVHKPSKKQVLSCCLCFCFCSCSCFCLCLCLYAFAFAFAFALAFALALALAKAKPKLSKS